MVFFTFLVFVLLWLSSFPVEIKILSVAVLCLLDRVWLLAGPVVVQFITIL